MPLGPAKTDMAKRNIHTLKLLSKARRAARNNIINKSDNELIKALSQVILNVLYGGVKLKQAQKKRLRPYRRTLIQLTNKSTPLKTRRQLLTQRGGFLMTLLPPAIAFLSSLLLK